VSLSAQLVSSCGQPDPPGNTKKPATHRGCCCRSFRIAGQNQKNRLKSVFGQVFISNCPPAHAKNHSSVAADEPCKRRLIVEFQESMCQHAVIVRGKRIGQPNGNAESKGHWWSSGTFTLIMSGRNAKCSTFFGRVHNSQLRCS
jgi:hypothetical protein